MNVQPINWAAIAIQQIVVRIVAANDISYESFMKFISDSEYWLSILTEVNYNNPLSVVHGVSKLIEEYRKKYNYNTKYPTRAEFVEKYSKKKNIKLKLITVFSYMPLILPLLRNCKNYEIVFEETDESSAQLSIVQITTGIGKFYLIKSHDQTFENFFKDSYQDPYDGIDLIVEEDKTIEDIYEMFHELFWSNNDFYIIDYDESEELSFQVKPFKRTPVSFEHFQETEDFQKEILVALQKNSRRICLCRGVPGSGKTTFAFHLEKIIDSKKSIYLTISAFDNFPRSTFHEWMKFLKPEFLLIDDIDRSYDLTIKLSFFENHYYDVPLTLMTCNNIEDMDEAFIRAGRVTNIFDFAPPEEEKLKEMIFLYLKNNEMEFPPIIMEDLYAIYMQYSSFSFVETYVERLKLYGDDYKVCYNDYMFGFLRDLEEEG